MAGGMSLDRLVIHDNAVDGLKREPGVKADTRRRGERMLARGQAIAPVLSGHYRDNLHLEEDADGGVRLVSDTEYTMVIEAHNGVLAKSLDAAGGD